MHRLIYGLDRFNNLTTRLAGYLATVALAMMAVVVTIHVVMRYGFSYSFEWTEEVSRNLMVWMVFLFFPTGHKRGMNIAVEFAVAPWAHSLAGKLLKLLIEILAMVVLVTALSISLKFVERGMGTSSQALQLTMGYIYMVVPVSFAITLLCAGENFLRLVAGLVGIAVPEPLHLAAARVD